MSIQQIKTGELYSFKTTVTNNHNHRTGNARYKTWVVTNAGIDDWRFLKLYVAKLFVEYYAYHVSTQHPIDGFRDWLIAKIEVARNARDWDEMEKWYTLVEDFEKIVL